MQGNTKLIAVIVVCITLLSAVGISFATGAFHTKAKEPHAAANNSPQVSNAPTTEPTALIPGSESIDSTPKTSEIAPAPETKGKLETFDVKALSENPYFNPAVHEFKELKEESVKISKASAIKKATSAGSAGSQTGDAAKHITALLVKYTNKETPQLPGSKVILKNYPVWIVTLHGVNIQKHGGPKKEEESDETPETFLADVHVFIDANSGVWLTTISHTSMQNK